MLKSIRKRSDLAVSPVVVHISSLGGWDDPFVYIFCSLPIDMRSIYWKNPFVYADFMSERTGQRHHCDY